MARTGVRRTGRDIGAALRPSPSAPAPEEALSVSSRIIRVAIVDDEPTMGAVLEDLVSGHLGAPAGGGAMAGISRALPGLRLWPGPAGGVLIVIGLAAFLAVLSVPEAGQEQFTSLHLGENRARCGQTADALAIGWRGDRCAPAGLGTPPALCSLPHRELTAGAPNPLIGGRSASVVLGHVGVCGRDR
jgi:hypothetical protein